MKQKKTQFPAEEVTLPSKGLLYPEDSPLRKGIIEMKYMTAREEDILTNPNLIENGTVIDKLLESLIVTPIDYNTLLTGDKDAVLVAARVLGYGSDYTFDYRGEKITVDLNTIKDKQLDESLVVDGKNEFHFTNNVSGVLYSEPIAQTIKCFKPLNVPTKLVIEKDFKACNDFIVIKTGEVRYAPDGVTPSGLNREGIVWVSPHEKFSFTAQADALAAANATPTASPSGIL